MREIHGMSGGHGHTKTGEGVESAQQGGLLIKELGQESVLEEVTLNDDQRAGQEGVTWDVWGKAF